MSAIFPASHYVVPMEKIKAAAKAIEEELEERVKWFQERGQAAGGPANCGADQF